MKKLLIAFSMIGTSALIACATDNGTPTTEAIDWFEVTTTNPQKERFTIPEGTSWINNGEKFEVESDLDNLVSFEPTDSLTQKMAQVSFTLDAAIVPGEQLPSLTGKAKVAFAISETTGFNAWNGTAWVPLTGVTVPTEGASFDLLVEFDNREAGAQKVRFSVNETVLKDEDDAEWISYSEAVTETVKVGFAGSGMITSFEGDQIKVTAEIIPVGGGTITIKEEDLAKFKEAKPDKYTKVDDFIADDAQTAFGSDNFKATGIKVGEAYALGLVAENKTTGKMAPVDGGELKAHAVAQANNANGIELGLNVTPPADTGATIEYVILDADGKQVETSQPKVIPNSALGRGLKTFKIRAIVKPAPLN